MVYLSWYLLQMRILGKVASLIGSVEETRLVDTVEVVNCSTVLVRAVLNGILVTFEVVHYCTLSLFDIWVTRQSAEWEPPISTGTL